jgi:hypothetical protein
MISLILPPKSQISQAANMLAQEYGTALVPLHLLDHSRVLSLDSGGRNAKIPASAKLNSSVTGLAADEHLISPDGFMLTTKKKK